MPRIDRDDCAGRNHHVFFRGLCKREIFGNSQSIVCYLTLLAEEIEKGRISVSAYSFMMNHVHLIITSLTGELSLAIGGLNNNFSKIYNQISGRTGPLFGSRFGSRPLYGDDQLRTAVRYTEMNAVAAGLCQHPADHPYSSAWAWRNNQIPEWLDTTWFTDKFVPAGTSSQEATELYLKFVGGSMSKDEWNGIADLGFVTTSTRRAPGIIQSGETLDWLRERNFLADGANLRFTRKTVQEVMSVLSRYNHQLAIISARSSKRIPLSEIAQAGVLHQFVGTRYRDLAKLMGVSATAITHRVKCHREEMKTNPGYAQWLEAVCAELST